MAFYCQQDHHIYQVRTAICISSPTTPDLNAKQCDTCTVWEKATQSWPAKLLYWGMTGCLENLMDVQKLRLVQCRVLEPHSSCHIHHIVTSDHQSHTCRWERLTAERLCQSHNIKTSLYGQSQKVSLAFTQFPLPCCKNRCLGQNPNFQNSEQFNFHRLSEFGRVFSRWVYWDQRRKWKLWLLETSSSRAFLSKC